ncbi:MAG TPA: hypothetical protein VF192_06430 [Longimicrobiales bacterium]
MAQHDARDFVAAFVVGAALGAAAALLLRPEPPTRAQRILRDLDPYRKRIGKRVRRMSRGLTNRRGLKADLLSLGRDLLQDLRAEADQIVADARAEISRAVEEEVERTRRQRGRVRA